MENLFMMRSKKWWLALVVLVGAALLGASSPAKAAITLRISTDGGATFADFVGGENDTDVDGSVTANGVRVKVTATTNQPNQQFDNADFARVSQVQTTIDQVGPQGLPIDLVVRISDTAFFLPPTGANATLSSSVKGTLGGDLSTSAAVNAVTFQSAADYSNQLFGGLPVTVSPPTGATSGPVTTILQPFAIFHVGGTTLGVGPNTVDSPTVVAATPFSLSNEFRILGLTIGNGASLELTGTTTLTAVPAPPTMVLALGGLPVLGLGRWLRRRRHA